MSTLAGTWTGENAFVLMPTDAPATAPVTARIDTNGLALTVGYVWHHPADGEQRGLLMVARAGDDADAAGAVPLTALWSDTWHQQPGAQTLTGSLVDGDTHVECVYAEGDWRWRILLEQGRGDDAGALVLRMVNVVPVAVAGGDEPLAYDAMRAVLRRAAAPATAG